MAARCVLAALLALPLSTTALTRPEGCSEYRWTGVCAGFAITCESLAVAGLICGAQSGGVGTVGECQDRCAEPCCITTTTTTQTITTSTATLTTMTSSSTTVTSTTATATLTSSTTLTTTTLSTTTLTTTTQTATITGSTVTHTATTSATTSSLTGTTTVSTATTSTATTSTATMTTSTRTTSTDTTQTMTAGEMGPSRRLVVRIKVTGVQDETSYVTDNRVSTAYRETMEEVTGLGKEKVDLQMVVTAPGNLTVSYILTVPEADASSSMEQVKQSLMKETASSFSAKLQENMDALVGHGHYTQQVVSMEPPKEDGAIGVSATQRPRPHATIWIATMLAVAWAVSG